MSGFTLPAAEPSASLPKWVLEAVAQLSNASDIKVLLFLAERARYRRSTFGPGEIHDATGLDYRTTTASLKRLGELGYIVSAGGVHALYGACASVAQRLHKSTPKAQAEKPLPAQENENAISPKDLEGLKRTLKEKKNPPTPQGGARESAAPVRADKTVSFPELLSTLDGFTEAWSDWLAYRRQRRLTVASITLTAQLGMLTTQPDPVAVIRQSIEKGWAGLFSLKSVPAPRPAPHQLDQQDWDAVAERERLEYLRAASGGWN